MNIKSVKLRITNKRLKSELKKCRCVISIKENANLSLSIKKDICSNLISNLEDVIENQQNEAKHLEKENTEYLHKYHTLSQENLWLERNLEVCKKKLDVAEIKVMEAKELTKKYEENINRLSISVAKLTKEKEDFKGKGIANKVKNIFKKKVN